MKKIIIWGLVVVAVIVAVMMTTRPAKKTDIKEPVPVAQDVAEPEETSMSAKALVVYFSQTNNTEEVAEVIARHLGIQTFEIEAAEPYSDEDINYRVMTSRANREQNDDTARPEIVSVPNLDEYDTIYLGYPIWWETFPKIINTLIETHVLDGKKIVAFCTSGSSAIDKSVQALQAYGLDVIASHRFSAGASDSEIVEWVETIK
ncbi:flavodoxin [bacterium]|nr:flavodoxin [bacterium]MBQ6436563.1 flavodoxin [bacterium]